MTGMNIIKTGCSFLLLILTCHVAAAETIRASVMPDDLTIGDHAVLQLSIPIGGGELKMPELPAVDGIRWTNQIGQRRNISIINGKQTGEVSLTIGFIPLREGTFTIPPVKAGTRSANKVTFSVRKPQVIENEEDAAKQLAFAKMELSGKKREVYYAGEEIPLVLSIFVQSPYGGDLRDAVLLFTPEDAAENTGELFRYPSARRTIGGKIFSVNRFGQTIRLLKPGNLSIRAALPFAVMENDGFFPRPMAQKTLHAALENITVKERPPLPAGTFFSGLAGHGWDAVYDLSPPPYRSGEPVTLKLDLTGYCNPALFTWQELKTNDRFRAYPPEIRREQERVTVRQTLIPLQHGELPLQSAVTVFDTEKGEYRTFRLNRTLAVEKGNVEQSVQPAAATEGNSVQPETETQSAADHFTVLMKAGDTGINQPYLISAILTGLGLASLGICIAVRIRRNRDPEEQKRKSVRAGREKLLRKIGDEFEDNKGLSTGSAAELAEYLSVLLNLPPGTSLAETVPHIKDPELANMIRHLAENLWLPSGSGKMFDSGYKKHFLKVLRRFSVIAVLLFAGIGLHAADPAPEAEIKMENDAETAFCNGDFDRALQIYQEQAEHRKKDPAAALYFNMGNCWYMKGDLPRALAEYEQAKSLEPRNPLIRRNLMLTRQKLGLPAEKDPDSMQTFCRWIRDIIRADEWLIAGAAGLMLCFAGTGLGLLYGRKILAGMYAAGVLLILLCSAAILTRPGQTAAVVVSAEDGKINTAIPVYTLPSVRSGKTEAALPPGREVIVEEQRQDWYRIRFDADRSGWIRKDCIREYTPCSK